MTQKPTAPVLAVVAIALATLGVRSQTPPAQPPPASQQPPQQPSEVGVIIKDIGGAPTRLAVPDFIALSPDAETFPEARFNSFIAESPDGPPPYHPLEQPVKLAHSSNLLDFSA